MEATVKFNNNINPSVGFQYQPTMKYFSNDYLFNVENLKNFFRTTRPGFKKTEAWIKICFVIINWYITKVNSNRIYFKKKKIKKN